MNNAIPAGERFRASTSLAPIGSAIAIKGELPGEGISKGEYAQVAVTAKDSHNERRITLGKKLAEGGEGSVFETSLNGYVAKIYRRDKLTTNRREKLRIMISKSITHSGICFPEALILNSQGEFVGYLMRKAKGFELGKSVFQPKLLLQKFPKWTRKDTIDLCITILEKIEYLNDRNVILGDINPANILVVSPKEVYFVDCDSYQVEGYPCPVGTANFTPPEAQGKDYKTFLRTQAMENFAIATLMFMIMLPGKPPYSAVGGESPEKNIRSGDFPYPLTEDTDKTPPGKWGFIWSQMAYKTKQAFFETFKKGEKHFAPSRRYDAHGWKGVFVAYRDGLGLMASNDPMAMDIFPTRKKGENIVERRTCKSCGKRFPITRNILEWEERKSNSEGQPIRVGVCDDCKSSRSRNHVSQGRPAGNRSVVPTSSNVGRARQPYARASTAVRTQASAPLRQQTRTAGRQQNSHVVGQGQAVSSSASSSPRSNSSQNNATSNASASKSALAQNAKKGGRALLYILLIAPLVTIMFVWPVSMLLIYFITGGAVVGEGMLFVSLIASYAITLYFFKENVI